MLASNGKESDGMNYLSVCSGIEAATVAWHDMGWNPLAFSEIEKFPSEALKHHYPTVPNLGDMTKYKEWDFGTNRLDLLVGGTPCQSFSVAGLRKGLEDPRGNLALIYCGILDKFRPKWFVWENVQGVLSSSGGRDFGSFLGALAELGYGFSYRVLDAQYFGVAQRRKRVFVVGHLGEWQPTAKVLFESESLFGNTKKSRTQREGITGYVESSFGQYRPDTVGGTTKASGGVLGGGSETFLTIPIHTQATQFAGGGKNRNDDGKGNGLGIGKDGEPMNTLTTTGVHAVAHAFKVRGGCEGGGKGYLGKDELAFTLSTHQDQQIAIGFDAYNSSVTGNISKTLDTGSDYHHVPNVYSQKMAVRRLTPVECERLQGFPDNYTNIKENCPDGPRYKALGNSMAVPVMKWIGNRIQMVENGLI
jgi:DNA (cytosine-5)-methyltransferase 1